MWSALFTSLVTAVVLASCRKHTPSTGDPTADWFADHRKDLDTVRAMLVADHGWSPAPPVVNPDTCRLTVATHYVPLRDGWYAHTCVEPRK